MAHPMTDAVMQWLVDHWGSVMEFLGCSPGVRYPRWLRRAYILTWPVMMPLRLAALILWTSIGFLFCLLIAVPGVIWDFALEARIPENIKRAWREL